MAKVTKRVTSGDWRTLEWFFGGSGTAFFDAPRDAPDQGPLRRRLVRLRPAEADTRRQHHQTAGRRTEFVRPGAISDQGPGDDRRHLSDLPGQHPGLATATTSLLSG